MAALDTVTLAEAKTHLRFATADYDTMLTAWITAVSIRVDDLCDPVVTRAIANEEHDGGRWVVEPLWKPAAITTVTEHDLAGTPTTLTAESATVKPADGYRLRGYLLERRSQGIARRYAPGSVLVSYSSGRVATTADVDPQIKEATLVILAHMWRAEVGAGSTVYDSEGLVSFGPAWAIPRRAADLLGGVTRLPALRKGR